LQIYIDHRQDSSWRAGSRDKLAAPATRRTTSFRVRAEILDRHREYTFPSRATMMRYTTAVKIESLAMIPFRSQPPRSRACPLLRREWRQIGLYRIIT
jgi:hypothetical protein